MNRRELLKAALAIPFLPLALPPAWAGKLAVAGSPASRKPAASGANLRARVRPGDAGWPSAAEWQQLKQQVGGRLLQPKSPFAGCTPGAFDAACQEALRHLKNPYYLSDQPALTQTSGWADAWTSQPSAYAVAASSSADVVARSTSPANTTCGWW